ncbi:MAG: mechanosensitive ion channel [Rhodobacteraceae bacterium]|nr:mechanosensitive ion channel [Paracoccaceae bacterium]
MLVLLLGSFVLVSAPVSAQTVPDTPTEQSQDSDFLASVEVDGEELFVLRGSTALPARERADRVQSRIVAAAEASEAETITIQVRDAVFGKEILVDGTMVTVATEADAEFEQIELEVLAGLHAEAIEAAILQYRAARTQEALVNSAVSAFAWSVAFIVVSYFFFARRGRLHNTLMRLAERRLEKVEEATKSILQRRAVVGLLVYLLHVIMWVIYLILFYYYLSFVLLSFPETRPVAQLLLNYVSAPLYSVVMGAVGYIPNIIMLVIIAFVTKNLIDGVNLFFDNLEQGVFEIRNFEKHWVAPTLFLAKVVIILIAFVFAAPYIPGSDSQAFQGLTILAGVMVSLGSNTVVSNMMSGLFVIYRRSANVGDRIQVGDKLGDVMEVKLMETVIKSVKNEMISIPNAQLLNSEVVNYTRTIDGRGLLIHSTVGIGYEEPPKKVEAMLVEAARRTTGLKKSPAPFVLWSQLADYAINYEINAYTSRGGSIPKIKSDLHQNIVDIFNENGTQIMTPSYIADPEIPKIPEGEWDGTLAHERAEEDVSK